jgi:hypothetical protein
LFSVRLGPAYRFSTAVPGSSAGKKPNIPAEKAIKPFPVKPAAAKSACGHPRQHTIKSELQRGREQMVDASSKEKQKTKKQDSD